jgi:hypothetical protein
MLTVRYTTSWGEGVELALYTDSYEATGGRAICAVEVPSGTGDGDEEDGGLELWNVLTVCLTDPLSLEWCADPSHVIIDTNNNERRLVDALVADGVIRMTGRWSASGFCRYPHAALTERALEALTGYEELAAALAAS